MPDRNPPDRNLIVAAEGRVEIAEIDADPVPDGGFRARTLFSGVSAVQPISASARAVIL